MANQLLKFVLESGVDGQMDVASRSGGARNRLSVAVAGNVDGDELATGRAGEEGVHGGLDAGASLHAENIVMEDLVCLGWFFASDIA